MTPFAIDSTPDAVLLRLNGELTIEVAGALRSALESALVPARPFLIDGRALTRIDAAILQVLLAAARVSLRAQLTAGSPIWTAAWQRHGITDPFNQPDHHA